MPFSTFSSHVDINLLVPEADGEVSFGALPLRPAVWPPAPPVPRWVAEREAQVAAAAAASALRRAWLPVAAEAAAAGARRLSAR
ncbi:unnamed protein product [Caenorhabditis auriculariae]|uniref:Uncharacterized protein n=1 Tax=Caenorhabditis auriculariae TaxID=2777116 RepID=A0A8S1H2B0_9PELO|nr:unnamed protein product [Caenorhabditis auriculariae]